MPIDTKKLNEWRLLVPELARAAAAVGVDGSSGADPSNLRRLLASAAEAMPALIEQVRRLENLRRLPLSAMSPEEMAAEVHRARRAEDVARAAAVVWGNQVEALVSDRAEMIELLRHLMQPDQCPTCLERDGRHTSTCAHNRFITSG